MRNIIDRVAPDPVAPIVALRDSLGLTAQQVARLQLVSDSLRLRVDALADSVLREVEGEIAAGAQLQQIFPRVQPRLQVARDLYVGAAKQAEEILTAEQWGKLPDGIRNPVLRGAGMGARGQGGGRRPPPGSGE